MAFAIGYVCEGVLDEGFRERVCLAVLEAWVLRGGGNTPTHFDLRVHKFVGLSTLSLLAIGAFGLCRQGCEPSRIAMDGRRACARGGSRRGFSVAICVRIEEWRRRGLRAMMVIVGSDRLVDMDDGTKQYSAK